MMDVVKERGWAAVSGIVSEIEYTPLPEGSSPYASVQGVIPDSDGQSIWVLQEAVFASEREALTLALIQLDEIAAQHFHQLRQAASGITAALVKRAEIGRRRMCAN